MSIVMPFGLKIIDSEDKNAQVNVAKNSTGTVVLSFTLKNNYRCFIAFVGESWDSALDTFLTKRVKVDGGTLYRLQDSKVQIAPPEQPQQELSPWEEVPQGSTISYEADLSNAGAVPAGGGNVTARIRVYYAAINP